MPTFFAEIEPSKSDDEKLTHRELVADEFETALEAANVAGEISITLRGDTTLLKVDVLDEEVKLPTIRKAAGRCRKIRTVTQESESDAPAIAT